MPLNQYQTAVARTFGKGAYKHIATISDEATLKAAIDATEDLVFQDILEALEDPKCDSKDAAVKIMRDVMERAARMQDMPYQVPQPEMAPMVAP